MLGTPIFLTEAPFGLTPTDAGFRSAGFVLLATAMRPVGGILSDKIGGQKILLGVFPATAGFAVCMACPLMITFTIGALGMAVAIGLGNGAVFKLVPESFPKTVGSVTGLVGAAGGLGGFFPPLALGMIRQSLGFFHPGIRAPGIVCAVVPAGLLEVRDANHPLGRVVAHRSSPAADTYGFYLCLGKALLASRT